jgi:primosomal protein DnaI
MRDLKKVIDNKNDIDLNLALKEVVQNEDIRSFINEHKITNVSLLESSLPQMMSYINYKKRCDGCKGLAHCTQNIEGYQPVLVFGNSIEMIYDECSFLIKSNETRNRLQNLTFYSFDNKIINEKGKIFVNKERSEVLDHLVNFVKNYKKDKFMKGLYIHGPFGRGKTYMLVHTAKELAEKGFKVIFAYYPNLVRELKSSIGNNTLEEMVRDLKETDILILDDLGGESNSAFIRDEVIGPILQYRMDAKKPAFFTSNLDLVQLTEHFALVSNAIDRPKASRLIERIKAISVEVELSGENYR